MTPQELGGLALGIVGCINAILTMFAQRGVRQIRNRQATVMAGVKATQAGVKATQDHVENDDTGPVMAQGLLELRAEMHEGIAIVVDDVKGLRKDIGRLADADLEHQRELTGIRETTLTRAEVATALERPAPESTDQPIQAAGPTERTLSREDVKALLATMRRSQSEERSYTP